MSSRNVRLDPDQRTRSTAIYQGLLGLRDGWEIDKASRFLEDAGFRIDYIAIADRDTLQPAPKGAKNTVFLIAAFVGEVRLIDNMES
jgi:pantoate--beta-alanine ligase